MELKQIVRNVLMTGTSQIKDFTVSGQFLTAIYYQALAARMALFDSVKVEHKPTLNGKAEYISKNNTMYLGFTSTMEETNKAIIIHEATHAVCDMLKMNLMIADSEVMAYVAQCQYIYTKSNYRIEGSTKSKDAIFAAAWSVAAMIQKGQTPSDADYLKVRQAVCSDSDYGLKSSAKVAAYDGLLI
ncbi:hypothetical protein BH20ACI1_BH20ACI1_01080 [soil metagenome]